MNDIYSSRKIEQACKRDINFIWILQGRQAPDHNTIARFRTKRLAHVIDDLFNQLVIKLGEFGEIEYKNIFIDGTKIEANANKYTFVWKKSTNKFEVKLQEKVTKTIQEINSEFNTEFIIVPETKIEVSYLQEILKVLNETKEKENIEFESCDDCQHKSKCTKAAGNTKMQVSKLFVEKRHKSLTNITSAEGILLRMNRSIQVEGAFGVMKEDHGFRLFLTRGKNNVKIEFTLLSFGYNINKLHNKIQNDRCGLFLHHKEIA